MMEHAENLEMDKTRERCFLFHAALDASRNPVLDSDRLTPREIVRELKGIIDTGIEELRHKQFAFVPTNKAEFFERDDLFGVAVKEATSDEINTEIKAAGNCLAADLNTAAVFHLMRVVEYAMRATVIHLHLPIGDIPIEHAEWKTLIELIEKEVRRKRAVYDRSEPKKREDFEDCKFYRMVADECFAFKEIWRNNVMHTQGTYSAPAALGVFERVRDFMQRLANRISLK